MQSHANDRPGAVLPVRELSTGDSTRIELFLSQPYYYDDHYYYFFYFYYYFFYY